MRRQQQQQTRERKLRAALGEATGSWFSPSPGRFVGLVGADLPQHPAIYAAGGLPCLGVREADMQTKASSPALQPGLPASRRLHSGRRNASARSCYRLRLNAAHSSSGLQPSAACIRGRKLEDVRNSVAPRGSFAAAASLAPERPQNGPGGGGSGVDVKRSDLEQNYGSTDGEDLFKGYPGR